MTDRNGRIGGKALPINSASIYIGGVNHLSIAEKRPYSFEGLTKAVTPEDTAITFDVHLKQGPIYLHTFFNERDGNNACGAYYVYVKRK
jgi:hypothetical protein